MIQFSQISWNCTYHHASWRVLWTKYAEKCISPFSEQYEPKLYKIWIKWKTAYDSVHFTFQLFVGSFQYSVRHEQVHNI